MTIKASGALSLYDISVELRRANHSATISFNDTNVRALARVPSGAISMSNFYNQAAFAQTYYASSFLTSTTTVFGTVGQRLSWFLTAKTTTWQTMVSNNTVIIGTNPATGQLLWRYSAVYGYTSQQTLSETAVYVDDYYNTSRVTSYNTSVTTNRETSLI